MPTRLYSIIFCLSLISCAHTTSSDGEKVEFIDVKPAVGCVDVLKTNRHSNSALEFTGTDGQIEDYYQSKALAHKANFIFIKEKTDLPRSAYKKAYAYLLKCDPAAVKLTLQCLDGSSSGCQKLGELSLKLGEKKPQIPLMQSCEAGASWSCNQKALQLSDRNALAEALWFSIKACKLDSRFCELEDQIRERVSQARQNCDKGDAKACQQMAWVSMLIEQDSVRFVVLNKKACRSGSTKACDDLEYYEEVRRQEKDKLEHEHIMLQRRLAEAQERSANAQETENYISIIKKNK